MASKDLIGKSYMKFPFLQKNDVPIFDGGDISNAGSSPSICGNFRSISQKEAQHDFDDSAKNKIRGTETESGKEKTKTIVMT